MWTPWLKQTWTSLGVLVNVVGQGLVFSFPSCLLPALKAPDSDIKVNLDTGSWIASSVGLSSMIGFVVCSFLMDWCGRRITHIVMIIPGIIGWILIYFSWDINSLMIGRILCGITVGGTVTLGAVIIGEFTSPEHRGLFLNLKTSAICVGTTIMHIMSSYFHWRTIALLSVVPLVVAIVNTCTWPESPSWLAGRSQFRSSETAFFWLRGTNDKSLKEFEAMVTAQKTRITDVKINRSLKDMFRYNLMKFTQKDFLKPLMVISVAYIIMEASGRHTFPAYAPEIVSSLQGGNTLNSLLYTLGIDIITVAATGFSCVLVKMFKRRTLLFFSALISSLILIVISIYMFLVTNTTISNDKPLIPMSLLVFYFIIANLGCTPIPIGLLGEIFPLYHRAFGIGVAGFVTSFFLMFALQFTPTMMNDINIEGTFLIIAVTMVICVVYLYFTLPETKDRTLQDIEDFFLHGRFIDEESLETDEAQKRLQEIDVKR